MPDLASAVLAACTRGGQAGGTLAATGPGVLLPVLAVVLLAAALLCRRARRGAVVALAVVGLVGATITLPTTAARAAACPDTPGGAVPPSTAKPAVYLVGAAVESINPTAAMIATKKFYLGGYGL